MSSELFGLVSFPDKVIPGGFNAQKRFYCWNVVIYVFFVLCPCRVMQCSKGSSFVVALRKVTEANLEMKRNGLSLVVRAERL